MIGGMSHEEFQNYLGLLSRLLRLGAKERESIEEELLSHLEDRLAALSAKGIEPARAVSMALAEFGDAAALAAEFTAVSRYYKRRWIMRLTIGSIAAGIITAAVLFSYWPGGTAPFTQNMAQAQQGEKIHNVLAAAREKLDANAQTRAKLEKLVDAEFAEAPLTQILDYLSGNIKVQYHLDKKALSEAGIESNTPVTFRLKEVPAEMIIRLIFNEIGLAYCLDNGVIIVTTREEAENRLETQVYRIDDLIYSPSAAKGKETTDVFAQKQNKVNYDSLIDLITSTVRPVGWDSVGGPGSIYPYRGTLVISQTADVHQELQKMLKDLRQSINPDIEDEARPISRGGLGGMGGGGMGGGMNGMFGGGGGMFGGGGGMGAGGGGMGGSSAKVKSGSKEPEKKDPIQPPAEKEKKGPKDPRAGGGRDGMDVF
jgi:uncharacterized membrane protein YgcG